jgi:hypothetical protein
MAKLYDWGDGRGKIHSKSKADHEKTVAGNKAAAGRVTDPPSGYYDPNLDVQQRDEQRAFDRNTDDLNLTGERAGTDLGFQTKRTGIEKARTGEDFTPARPRSSAAPAGRCLICFRRARAAVRTTSPHWPTSSAATSGWPARRVRRRASPAPS